MRRMFASAWIPVFIASSVLAAGSCVLHKASSHPTSSAQRTDAIKRAQVWTRTNVVAMDVTAGPQGPGAFAPGETVTCTYTERDMNGRSPKFSCLIAGRDHDDVKVKYGRDNAEVYGEVMGTRLLWALGFGADHMYPVRVICRGCPDTIRGGDKGPSGARVFDPAVIERKAPGWEIETYENQGWAWQELDSVDEEAGGAPIAHRDGLKLLAAMIQHSDSKPEQQRLACLDAPVQSAAAAEEGCAYPFMLIQDIGLTFGRTDIFYHKENYVNLDRWRKTSVWATGKGCIGNLYKPFLGTLERPVISEEGRRFLAGLLGQLRDDQIRDLFRVARVTLRSAAPNLDRGASTRPGATVEDWVAAFKHKRQEIEDRRCPPAK